MGLRRCLRRTISFFCLRFRKDSHSPCSCSLSFEKTKFDDRIAIVWNCMHCTNKRYRVMLPSHSALTRLPNGPNMLHGGRNRALVRWKRCVCTSKKVIDKSGCMGHRPSRRHRTHPNLACLDRMAHPRRPRHPPPVRINPVVWPPSHCCVPRQVNPVKRICVDWLKRVPNKRGGVVKNRCVPHRPVY